MLLTRKAWYGLVAVKRLAEQPRKSSFSAKDLADLYRITIADLKEQASSPTEVTMLGGAEARAAKRR